MPTTVFKTNNRVETLKPTTKRFLFLKKTKKHMGVCLSMSCDFLRMAYDHSGMLTELNKADMSSEFRYQITQGAYHLGMREFANVSGVAQKYDLNIRADQTWWSYPWTTLKGRTNTALDYAFNGPAGGGLFCVPGHAMAALRKSGDLYFFDPNYGLVTHYPEAMFREFVAGYLKNYDRAFFRVYRAVQG